MRYAVAAGLLLASCNNLANEAIHQATRPSVDAACASGLAHVRECDPRFPDRVALCAYSEGECAPYINASQSECLREASCEEVRGALERRGWLCGVSLAAGISGR